MGRASRGSTRERRSSASAGVEYAPDSTRAVESEKGDGTAQESVPQENRQAMIGTTPIIIVVAVIVVLVVAVGAVLWFLVNYISRW